MSTDLYKEIVTSTPGGFIAKRVGLPQPTVLDRFQPGQPVVKGEVVVGAAPGGTLSASILSALASAKADVATTMDDSLRKAAADAGLDAAILNPEATGGRKIKALVFDATGIKDSTQLVELQRFFHPTIGRVTSSGRIVVLGLTPELAGSARAHTAQRALEGFTRSAAKEVGRGSTAHLVYVDPGAEAQIESTLRFLLSPRSAFVSGQVTRISAGEPVPADIDWDRPLAGKRALVTGASRGIGAAIISTLARDGADVVGLDVPALGGDLRALCDSLGGEAIELDITADDAPKTLAAHFKSLDIVVHNAGVTRDRTLAKMPEDRWTQLMEINLSSEERINDALLKGKRMAPGARIIGVASIAGIAGNRGQTNYGTSKAGVIGMVQSMAPELAQRGITINAVAPGFIETQMTAVIPLAVREPGRRLASLNQGGLPIDVAETIAWFASSASGGVTGNVVRVCGQSLIGA